MDREIDNFIKTLVQTADDKGMQFAQREPFKYLGNPNWDADEVTKRLRDEILPAMGRRGPIDLLMVITPAKNSEAYAPIKRYCDCVAGIASQCVAKFNVQRKNGDRGFASNMLMKINSKLGAINVSIKEMPQILRTGTV